MLEPPPGVDDADVLAEVRRAWDGDVDRVAYLPVGFGAHHWAAYAGAEPRLFVTYDEPPGPDAAADLEAAYAGAVALRDGGLEFVLAPLPADTRAADRAVRRRRPQLYAVARRHVGRPLDLVVDDGGRSRRLHAAAPPSGSPALAAHGRPRLRRRPRPGLTGRRGDRVRTPTSARDAVRGQLGDDRPLDRRATTTSPTSARGRPWVAAHGEPARRQPAARPRHGTLAGRLGDRSGSPRPSSTCAPSSTAGVRAELGADPEMLELFDLEWRLDEISQYAAWFAAPHTGTARRRDRLRRTAATSSAPAA